MEKDKEPAFKHGMFEDTANFSHKEKLRVWESAEDYIERLGGEEACSQAEQYDAYLLALTEYRIARAEGIMFENVEQYLNEQAPERNLDMLVSRRQNLRKDLGLLTESPEQKQADSAEGFFDALSGDSDDE